MGVCGPNTKEDSVVQQMWGVFNTGILGTSHAPLGPRGALIALSRAFHCGVKPASKVADFLASGCKVVSVAANGD